MTPKMNAWNTRRKEIIDAYYELCKTKGKTHGNLAAVARSFDITRERVRQIVGKGYPQQVDKSIDNKKARQ